MNANIELVPYLTRGVITALNETCITVNVVGRLGTITVPLRWIFTDTQPAIGQTVEFYFSYMKTVLERNGKRSVNEHTVKDGGIYETHNRCRP